MKMWPPASRGHQQYHLLSLNRHLPKGVYYGFLPLWVDDNCYRSSDPDINRRKARLRSLWRDILRKMLRKVRIDAVMSGELLLRRRTGIRRRSGGTWRSFHSAYEGKFENRRLCSFFQVFVRNKTQCVSRRADHGVQRDRAGSGSCRRSGGG